MFHRARFGVLLVLVAGLLCPSLGWSGPTDADTFAVFDTPDLNRRVHGQKRGLDLDAGSYRLGDATAFFGVDALSDKQTHYLSSGLQWQSSNQGTPLLSMGAMHTTSQGATPGNQTLMRATSRLDLGGRWYRPDIVMETDQLTGHDQGGRVRNGRAARLGLGHDFSGGSYRLQYFTTGPDYDPWGGGQKAGDRGAELSGAYELNDQIKFRNTLMMHSGSVLTGTGHGLVENWRMEGTNKSPLAVGQPWYMSARFGKAGWSGNTPGTPLSLEVAPRTRSWLDWEVDSLVGWYQGGIGTPDGLPVDGGLWRISASRELGLGMFRTRFQPSFSLGGSRFHEHNVGSRTRLALDFPGLPGDIALSVNYLSAGWGPTRNRSAVRMALSISHSLGSFMPALDTGHDVARDRWFDRL